MKCIIKNCLYLVVMIGMSFGECFGMHREGEEQCNVNYEQPVERYNSQPGGYGNPAIARYPSGTFGENNMPPLPATPLGALEEQRDVERFNRQGHVDYPSYPTLSSDAMPNSVMNDSQKIFADQQNSLNHYKQKQSKLASQQQVEEAQVKAEQLQLKLRRQRQNITQQVGQPEESHYSRVQIQQSQVSQVPKKEQPEKQKNQSFQRTKGSGTFKDLSDGIYAYGNYRLQSFFEKILQPFKRTANSTTLTLILIGNTYEELYVEDNEYSTLFRIELFNRYKKGKKINSVSSTHKGISIGDYEDVYVNPDKDQYSTNKVWSIDRKTLAALITAGVALKYGTVSALFAAGGMASQSIFIVPCLLAGCMFFPMFIAIGGSIVAIVLGTAGVLAGAAITTLAPVAIPLVLVAALLRS